MEWKQFTEVTDKVKDLTTILQGETGKIEQIRTEFSEHLRDALATPEECEVFSQISKRLDDIQYDLKTVKGKGASEEIIIEFVGATSSGKSSLINALLRERRLPVGFMQTTMCSIKVCTTEQKEWSVTVTDGTAETVRDGETETVGDGETETERDGETETVKDGETETVRDGETETERDGETESVRDGETETVRDGETETERDGETETVKDGETETVRDGETETERDGETETVRDGETETERDGETETVRDGETVVLSTTMDEKAIRDLLSQMSGRKNSENRKEMGIHTRSIVQVNWPKDQCKVLPLNVVLFDTPGFGEDEESMKVVSQSCRKADIIVAVMDAMSPSKATVAKLVKEVDCQFTFGVFTKWDECIKKAEEENEATVDLEQAREDCEKDFRDELKNQCEVFFVNVKECVGNNHGGFKAFEDKLASSATKLKGESLIKQAKSISVKSAEISEKFRDMVTTRKEEKIASLKKKLASIDEDCAAFNEMSGNLKSSDEIEDIFSEDAKTKLIQEFEEAVVSGKSERAALEQFLGKVNKNIKDTMDSKREDVKTAFENWTGRAKCSIDLNMNKLMSDQDAEYPQARQFENQALPADLYVWYWDPNYYYTNNYIWGGAVALATAAGGFASGVALATWIAIEGIPFVGGGTALGAFGGVAGNFVGDFRFGDRLKRISPISDYKLRCWRASLNRELEKLHNNCREKIYQEIDRIHGKYLARLDNDKDWASNEIKGLHEESHSLTKWAKQLDESRKDLQRKGNELDMLLAKLREDIARAEEEIRRKLEYDRQVAIMQTCLY